MLVLSIIQVADTIVPRLGLPDWGVTFIIVIWFIGFIVLGLIWLMSRPKDNVLIYGPDGQQVTVSEKEAQRRVKRGGWTYQPPTQPTG